MQSGSKTKCASASHQHLIDNAKNRLDNLQERFTNLQAARKEGRFNDVMVLEEQVSQIIREWNTELNAPSPASSFLGGPLASFSDDIARLLQLYEEEDDATSGLVNLEIKPQPNVQHLHPGTAMAIQEDYLMNNKSEEYCFLEYNTFKGSSSSLPNTAIIASDLSTQLDYHQVKVDEESGSGHLMDDNNTEECKKDTCLLMDDNGTEQCKKDTELDISPNIRPPPSAFMGPKCALWDCSRPALGSDLYVDYCSSFHANLALEEAAPGIPVERPNGISLKDNLLFLAVTAKAQGKNVGIPECEGAATAKCPWNATGLFDLSLLKGETIREWLFFDKHRRAFETGTRKQRSLPDHNGRGWHESRKQVMKEYGGQKRSYYMDPQPAGSFEWHLFEYEICSLDAYALYRLEVKLVSKKKSSRGKVSKHSLADLQKKMGQLTAEVPGDNRSHFEVQIKTDEKVDPANANLSQHEMFDADVLNHDSAAKGNHPGDCFIDYNHTY